MGRQWLAIIASGEMIDERRRNSGGLLQVVFEDMVMSCTKPKTSASSSP
jgi:hypothetical protein